MDTLLEQLEQAAKIKGLNVQKIHYSEAYYQVYKGHRMLLSAHHSIAKWLVLAFIEECN